MIELGLFCRLLKWRCYGNQFSAKFSNWPSFGTLAFQNGFEYRNSDRGNALNTEFILLKFFSRTKPIFEFDLAYEQYCWCTCCKCRVWTLNIAHRRHSSLVNYYSASVMPYRQAYLFATPAASLENGAFHFYTASITCTDWSYHTQLARPSSAG